MALLYGSSENMGDLCQLFDVLSKARGEVYKITNEGGRVVFERVID